MNALVKISGDQLVTTTQAVASGTENEHASVIKLVRTYQGDLEEFGPIGFETRKGSPLPQGGFGKATEYAVLNEDQAALLITYMRNNAIVRRFKIELVRSFGEMRRHLASAPAVPALPDFTDPAAAARAWADAKDAERLAGARVGQLEHKVAELAPAAAGLERIANTDDAMCVTDAAKTLQMAPGKFRDMLLEKKWIYPRQGKRGHTAYQDKIHAGYLKHKYFHYEDPDSGEQKSKAQVLVTSKGIAKLSKLLSEPATQNEGAE